MNLPQKRTLPFYQHPNFFRSPTLSPRGLPVYAEELAIAFANESSDSSSHYISHRMRYDSGVVNYLDLSASESESDDIEIEYCSGGLNSTCDSTLSDEST